MLGRKILPPVSVEVRQLLPSRWDVLAALLVLGFIVLFAQASRTLSLPLTSLTGAPLSLSPWHLPEYALRTGLRMLIAMGVSLVFTFSYATLAAKSARAGTLLIPLLDILQSVPILGFISVTVTFFLSLANRSVLGAELACVFALFTSQAWNMAFSFYQSLRTVPVELMEAGELFGLNAWARFWRIEVPFAMPPLIWNMMMSMSGGWFFIVAAEAISVGDTNIALPGIGSYIARAIELGDLGAIFWAIGTMLVVILIYDQLMFRPLVAWANRFRIDQEQTGEEPESWMLDLIRRARLFDILGAPVERFMHWTYRLAPKSRKAGRSTPAVGRLADISWYGMVAVLVGFALWQIYLFSGARLPLSETVRVLGLGLITLLRVLVLIALASAIWTPLGILIGLRPRLAQVIQPIAQFMAAFPANLLFPVVVYFIATFALNPDIWLSPLMVLGTQWYILFNVIAGASAMPRDMRDAGDNFQVRGILWWKRIGIPAVLPYFVTGAITASGGSWNAAIVAEFVSWRGHAIAAHGLGAYIAENTARGDFHRIVLGIAVMAFLVTVINRAFWRPLYWYAERKYRLT
ncbi:MAG TPA: ABC transporter permease subunit [Rhizomicrobium sp.]|nr:ABC transporter permease subunit [Rhizomicrobium sp.]